MRSKCSRLARLAGIGLLLTSLTLAGCGLSSAAKVMKSYRISLGAFQDAEIAAYQKGFISQPKHIHDQADVEKLANFGIIADKAILASDKATVLVDVQNGLDVLTEIETNDVTAIGDATARSAVEVAVAGLKNLLTQVQLSLGVK